MSSWLTPPEAAERLGVHVRTLARWSDNGTLTADEFYMLPSGQRRYRVEAIDRLLNARGTSSRESGESDLSDPAANRVGQAHPNMNGTVAQTHA